MLALLARQPGGLLGRRRAAWMIVVCTGVVLVTVAVGRGGLSTDQRLIYAFGFTLLSWFFAAILTLATTATREGRIARLMASPTRTLFGR